MTERGNHPAFEKQKGRGRPKGAQNKTTKAAKEAIAEAAERLGSTDRLVAWAREDPKNEHAFWASIYPKLLPLDVNNNHSGQVIAKVVFKGLNADG